MQKVNDILPGMIDSLGMHQKFKHHLVFFYWDKIVGSDIAAQSVPVDIEYGTLYISVENSVWSHHLLMMKADILYKINHFIGEPLIRDLKFRNNALTREKFKEDDIKDENNIKDLLKGIALNESEACQAGHQCEEISDDDLKKKVFRVYEKHLRLKKAKLQQNWHKCGECDSLCPEKELYCQVCAFNKRQKRISEIRNELLNVPWATYADINQHIPCMSAEYIDAKVSLLHGLASSIAADDDNSIAVKTLTMLFTGAKYDKVDARLIQKTLAKFRRKNYVSTSRS